MKRMEIIVDTLDEFKEVEKEVLTTKLKNKYKEIEVFCRETSSTYSYRPSPTEDDSYIYFKSCE